jgi:hypothetical protein
MDRRKLHPFGKGILAWPTLGRPVASGFGSAYFAAAAASSRSIEAAPPKTIDQRRNIQLFQCLLP